MNSYSQQTRLTYPLLLLIIGIALGLRVWGTSFGLPYVLTHDEAHEVIRAFKLAAGEYYWRWQGKGMLYYLLFVEYVLLYILWWVTGQVADAREFALQYFQDPSVFYLAGRLTSALLGTLTCLVVFFIGKRLYDWRIALGAAFIGATSYNHGAHSHIINVDIGTTLAIWASIWAFLEYERKRERRWLLVAGALGGLAIAFKSPGVIVVPILLLMIATSPAGGQCRRKRVNEAGIILLTTLVTFTIVSPEWLSEVSHFSQQISNLLGRGEAAASSHVGEADADPDIDTTSHKLVQWAKYSRILLKDYEIVLSFTTLLGIALSLWRRRRWELIWSVFIILFFIGVSVADRNAVERYLLPILPAFWLLSSWVIFAVFGRFRWLTAIAFACVTVISLVTLIKQDYFWIQPDTRVLAKAWIENHIPAGAKILMDGTRHRFVMSPPLNPDESTVGRLAVQVGDAEYVSRGISRRALDLYAEAMERVKGPTYELHSTVWGRQVEDLTYYVQACFDYIITSSYLTERYMRDTARQRSPHSAQFYEQLRTDSRVQVVYSVAPPHWKHRGISDGNFSSSGYTITVYKVISPCQTPTSNHTDR